MKGFTINYLISFVITGFLFSCNENDKSNYGLANETTLKIVQNQKLGTIEIYREGGRLPILTQHARPNHRPYLHPIIAPDGKGVLTEYSPSHHPHQTGLYWGFTRINGNNKLVPEDSLNSWFYNRYFLPNDGNQVRLVRSPESIDAIKNGIGRDYFHNAGKKYWQLDSASVLQKSGSYVSWQTVYNMLGDDGSTLMVETQRWTMRIVDGKYIIDHEWLGDALDEIVVNKFNYGAYW